jgi:outer membrane protein
VLSIRTRMKYSALVVFSWALFSYFSGWGQKTFDTIPVNMTLDQCVDYALKNQPVVRQLKVDQLINNKDIAISLSGWFPQVNLNANLEHFLQLPVTFAQNPADPSGPKIEEITSLANISTGVFSATQSLYSTDLVFASKTAHDLRLLATRNTENSQINGVYDVSKSFYDVVLTIEQLGLWNEEIQRLQRNYQDAYNLFQSGLTDKIDYQQAQIAVNNALAQKRSADEAVKEKYAILKQTIGFPPDKRLQIIFDSLSFETEILADTLKHLTYENRIEYQVMQTELSLSKTQIGYYRWSFLPSLSAFYDYNLAFENDKFSALYNANYPNSLIGLTLSLPLFQGTNRLQKLRKANLQDQRLNIGLEDLKNHISSQYVKALAEYKSNIYALRLAKSNNDLALNVFNAVSAQYKQGIKTYLNLLIAETDLRTAKLNYLGVLYQVFSSKLDLKASMGEIVIK